MYHYVVYFRLINNSHFSYFLHFTIIHSTQTWIKMGDQGNFFSYLLQSLEMTEEIYKK